MKPVENEPLEARGLRQSGVDEPQTTGWTRSVDWFNLGAFLVRCVISLVVLRQIGEWIYTYAWAGCPRPTLALWQTESLSEEISVRVLLGRGVWGWLIPVLLALGFSMFPGRVKGSRICQRLAVFLAVALLAKYYLVYCVPWK